MALSTKLMMRQGQSLVMTPQLLQAIKLLQFSSLELAAFVNEELERNPLLERAEEAGDPASLNGLNDYSAPLVQNGPDQAKAIEGDWCREDFATQAGSLDPALGAEIGNSFDEDRTAIGSEPALGTQDSGLSAESWTGTAGQSSSGGDFGELSSLEAYVAAPTSLHEHLSAQLQLACKDSQLLMIGAVIIDAINESGYLDGSLEDIAIRLSVPLSRVEAALAIIHTFEPTGIGARNLAECLKLQLMERDRFDPAMQALIGRLDLVARRDINALRKICNVDEDDVADMIAEIRRLDPKPGRAFGTGVIQPVIPDVSVRAANDGSWLVELNADALPRLLVNQTWAARVIRGKPANPEQVADKTFITNCLQTAHWLTKSLEQRARTILKVSSEIVRQQDAFLTHGVGHLRPLNLRNVADAIGMHESTVSRVTTGKYMVTPRGMFELKYFFTASIPAHAGATSHSAEAVRFRIKQMIDQESIECVLSDDAIVARLKEANIDIARRTVAKYRESLRIPSSVERRREKQTLLVNA